MARYEGCQDVEQGGGGGPAPAAIPDDIYPISSKDSSRQGQPWSSDHSSLQSTCPHFYTSNRNNIMLGKYWCFVSYNSARHE